MKKIIFSLTLLFFVLNLFSQAPTTPNHSRDYYLKKSKNQKKAANILLAGGAVCILTAFLIPKGEVTNEGWFYTEYSNDGIKSAFGGIGGLSILGSIPFYILSSKNKRKANAATISFNNHKVLSTQQNTFVLKTQPTLTLKIIL